MTWSCYSNFSIRNTCTLFYFIWRKQSKHTRSNTEHSKKICHNVHNSLWFNIFNVHDTFFPNNFPGTLESFNMETHQNNKITRPLFKPFHKKNQTDKPKSSIIGNYNCNQVVSVKEINDICSQFIANEEYLLKTLYCRITQWTRTLNQQDTFEFK